MKKIILFITMALGIVACKGGGSLLPNVSGKAGEILIVTEKADWEGSIGNDIRALLACDCPYLAQQEPLYTLVNVIPSGFTDLFKIHRNIIIINITPEAKTPEVYSKHDVWASPQCVIQIDSPDAEGISRMLKEKGEIIVSAVEQAERNRVIANAKRYEQGEIALKVREVFPGSPHFPIGYTLRKLTPDFAWISDEKQYTNQTILLYRYPAEESEPFTLDNIVAHRNEMMKANVPGMFENTYMTTGTYFPLDLKYMKYQGRDIAQLRGMWEVENDFMGGPFVSHSFYSPDGKDIIVAEAFVYAPKYDKRQYLRQVESILYSWDWNDASAVKAE